MNKQAFIVNTGSLVSALVEQALGQIEPTALEVVDQGIEAAEREVRHRAVEDLLHELEAVTDPDDRLDLIDQLEGYVGKGQAKKFAKIKHLNPGKNRRDHRKARNHKRDWE